MHALQKQFDTLGIDAFIVPTADAFQNEFVPQSAQRLSWVSNFTGSAGMAVILKNKAALFVDSRYTVQAHQQSPTFEIRHYTPQEFNIWARENNLTDKVLGYDPWLHTKTQLNHMAKSVKEAKPLPCNPIDALWIDRPVEAPAPVILLNIEQTGESTQDKCQRIGHLIEAQGANCAFLVDIMSSCWLLNMRGADIPNTPAVLCYTLIHKNGHVDLFGTPAQYPKMPNNVTLYGFTDLPDKLKETSNCLVSPMTPMAILHMMTEPVFGEDPCLKPKAIKNIAEINGMKEAQRLDAIAMRQFLTWLKKTAPQETETELSVAKKLEKFRFEDPNLEMASFNTISATGANAALPHYQPTLDHDTPIKSGDIYLVDSGGQYFGLGTTDITRTIIIGGNATDKQKYHYTLVLKGHIALACAVFLHGTTGGQLDILARQFLWQEGLDYGHGTGHGVGHYLSVHEGPQSISPRTINQTPLEPGMILSNEPGFYLEGHYGIRLENLILVVEKVINKKPMCAFETLTHVPFDDRLIDTTMLTKQESLWLEDYKKKSI